MGPVVLFSPLVIPMLTLIIGYAFGEFRDLPVAVLGLLLPILRWKSLEDGPEARIVEILFM